MAMSHCSAQFERITHIQSTQHAWANHHMGMQIYTHVLHACTTHARAAHIHTPPPPHTHTDRYTYHGLISDTRPTHSHTGLTHTCLAGVVYQVCEVCVICMMSVEMCEGCLKCKLCVKCVCVKCVRCVIGV